MCSRRIVFSSVSLSAIYCEIRESAAAQLFFRLLLLKSRMSNKISFSRHQTSDLTIFLMYFSCTHRSSLSLFTSFLSLSLSRSLFLYFLNLSLTSDERGGRRKRLLLVLLVTSSSSLFLSIYINPFSLLY